MTMFQRLLKVKEEHQMVTGCMWRVWVESHGSQTRIPLSWKNLDMKFFRNK